MDYEDFKKSITQADYPVVKLFDWCFFLIDEGVSKDETSKNVYAFYEEYRSTLKQDIKHNDISQVLKEIEEFRHYKVELLKALKSDNRVDALIDMVSTLSKRGHSKVAIYEIFTTFYAYVYYRSEIGDPELSEYDADLIADAVLDGLWGGGWDKGNRLLPEEPDVADTKKQK